MRVIAAAKINWTLEVLGRPDSYRGYHEVRSVMQTIDLCDEVRLAPALRPGPSTRLRTGSGQAQATTLSVEGPRTPSEGDPATLRQGSGQASSGQDLALRAAGLLAETAGRAGGAAIRLTKRIPIASGLGGGSSDAAAVLRGLNQLWRLGFEQERLAGVAAGVGSDAPFFVYGGTALAQGRGERIAPLPDAPETWIVLLAPPFSLPEKTKRMYRSLTPADFSDGARSEALARHIVAGQPIDDGCLYNAFERAANEIFPGLAAYRDALLAAGARRVHLAGSGPALFAVAAGEREARQIQRRLRSPGGETFVARTLAAREALAVQE